ncbi:MAG: serine hydrolase [Myxococcales bacterium]
MAGLVALALAASAQAEEGFPKACAKAIDKAVVKEMEKEEVVGLAIGVIEDGRIVYLQGYGYEDRDKGVKVDPRETRYRWASLSKPLTAIATMQLVEQGKLALSDDARRWVPGFPKKEHAFTVRHLLTHQSGLPNRQPGKVLPKVCEYEVDHPFADVETACDKFSESPLLFEPGTKYGYTTLGYILLSAVVLRAGGKPFFEQVKDRIATPLGMGTLSPDYPWQDIPHRAVGYRWKRKEGVVLTPESDVSWKLGGGGFLSTVEDLARFAEGVMNDRLVSEETRKAMWTPQKLSTGKLTDNGLGFVIAKDDQGRTKIIHNGSQEGAATRLMIYPAEKRAVVVMSSSEWAKVTTFGNLVLDAVRKTAPKAGTKGTRKGAKGRAPAGRRRG